MKITFAHVKAASVILAVIGFAGNLHAIPATISSDISSKSVVSASRFASLQDIFPESPSALNEDHTDARKDTLTVKPLISPPHGASLAFSSHASGFSAIGSSPRMTGLFLTQVPDGGNSAIMVGMSLLGLGFVGFIYRK